MDVPFKNGGLVDIQVGNRLTFRAGGATTGVGFSGPGRFQVGAAAAIYFSGSAGAEFSWDKGATFSGLGWVILNGTAKVTGGTVTMDNFSETAGVLTVNGLLEIKTGYSYTGGQQQGMGGRIIVDKRVVATFGPGVGQAAGQLSVDAIALSNSGTINVNAAGVSLTGGATIINESGGWLILNGGTASSLIALDTQSSVQNLRGGGIIAKGGSGGPSVIGAPLSQGGEIYVAGGTLRTPREIPTAGGLDELAHGGTLEIDGPYIMPPGFTLAGYGSLAGDVRDGGDVEPGDRGLSGTLNITGNYVQTGRASGSTWAVRILAFRQLGLIH